MMIVFYADMDNTLIYSYKYDIGEQKRCVELYQGRMISFVTDRTYGLLKSLAKHITIVPTTTRTVEQYERIQIGDFHARYALVCNGGILLINGKEDEGWYRESLQIIAPCRKELEKAERLLEKDKNRCMDVRNIRNLFLFTKSEVPGESVKELTEKLDMSLVDVMENGLKVYVVPKGLDKGDSIKRLQKRLGADTVIASGDSEFDIRMVNCADVGIIPADLERKGKFGDNVRIMDCHEVFAEQVLGYILERVDNEDADCNLGLTSSYKI